MIEKPHASTPPEPEAETQWCSIVGSWAMGIYSKSDYAYIQVRLCNIMFMGDGNNIFKVRLYNIACSRGLFLSQP